MSDLDESSDADADLSSATSSVNDVDEDDDDWFDVSDEEFELDTSETDLLDSVGGGVLATVWRAIARQVKEMMNLLDPRLDIPSRWTVARDIYKLFNKKKRQVKEELKDVPYFSATTDAGTSWICIG